MIHYSVFNKLALYTLVFSVILNRFLMAQIRQRREPEFSTANNLTSEMTDEQRLLQVLLNNYDSSSRPTYIASNSVNVKFQMTLIQISQLDEVNQVLTLNVWIEQVGEWMDERLHWNSTDYNNLETVRIPCHRLWLPDIVLYNSADDYTAGYMQSRAMVHSNGNVFWSPPAKLRSACKVDITYFPFDDQSCTMKFGSWAYDGWQVNISKRHEEVDTSNYVQNGEWSLLNVVVERFEVIYPCCEEPYPYILFTIRMRRRTLYYLFNIVVPCLWLTVLSLMSFWLPSDSGEKITLGITVLLAFSVFMLLIAEKMPATSEFVPLIGVYLTFTMAMTSLSIVLTVGVLHIHHRGPNSSPVPRKLRRILFSHLAPFMGMSNVRRYEDSQHRREATAEKIDQEEVDCTEKIRSYVKSKSMNRLSTCSSSVRKEATLPAMDLKNCVKMSHICTSDPVFEHQATKSGDQFISDSPGGEEVLGRPQSSRRLSSDLSGPLALEELSVTHRDLNAAFVDGASDIGLATENQLLSHNLCVPDEMELIEYAPEIKSLALCTITRLNKLILLAEKQQLHLKQFIQSLQKKQDCEEQMTDLINEWRMVAIIVDRMLFWIFLMVAISGTVIILVLMPMLKPTSTN